MVACLKLKKSTPFAIFLRRTRQKFREKKSTCFIAHGVRPFVTIASQTFFARIFQKNRAAARFFFFVRILAKKSRSGAFFFWPKKLKKNRAAGRFSVAKKTSSKSRAARFFTFRQPHAGSILDGLSGRSPRNAPETSFSKGKTRLWELFGRIPR
jgi:hypothetical protein